MAFRLDEQESTSNLIQPGTYQVNISDAQIKASRNDAHCHMIACVFSTETGRKIFQNFIIKHSDENTLRFNLAKLADCLFAVKAPNELSQVEDAVSYLEAATLKVKVGIKKNAQRGTEENTIYEYYTLDGAKRGSSSKAPAGPAASSASKTLDDENQLPF